MAIALGGVIGIALGLLGGGGSILTVPIFVYVLHFAAKDAIAMSLAVVGLTSASVPSSVRLRRRCRTKTPLSSRERC